MSNRRSTRAALHAVSPQHVGLVVAALVLAISLGPETYLGLDEELLVWALVGAFVLFVVLRNSVGESGVETDPDTPASVGEHYRPIEGDNGGAGLGDDAVNGDESVPAGVYRVVGTGETVTLLRVGDADGRRVHTGQLWHVSQPNLDAGFEAATDPGAGFSPISGLRETVTGLYWGVRGFF